MFPSISAFHSHVPVLSWLLAFVHFSAAARASQVVVVLSGSMEPGFYRGDILFLYMGRRPLQSGEVPRLPTPCERRTCQLFHRGTHMRSARP
jgi:signal peptidase I